jgi:hypothetical protein
MARIANITNNGEHALPTTVTDAVMDNSMTRTLTELLAEKLGNVGEQVLDGDLTVRNLSVLGRASFDSLEIRKVTAAGGVIVLSAASCVISRVETAANGNFRCFFAATDGETTIKNNWAFFDLAYCQTFDATTGQRRYWRQVSGTVSGTDEHEVVLSAADGLGGSDVPQPGDTLVLLGNTRTASRRNAIVLAAAGDGSPYIAQLSGVKTYSVDDSNILTLFSPARNVVRATNVAQKIGDSYVDLGEGMTAAGIDIVNGVITLRAEKTVVDGQLAVQRAACYYDNGNKRSEYNGNGQGTIVYYYPSGKVLREEVFITATDGSVTGLRTIYRNDDATNSVRWIIDENGNKQATLADYWQLLPNRSYFATEADLDTAIASNGVNVITAAPKANFAQFVSQSNNYAQYNNYIARGVTNTSASPSGVSWYTGVVVTSTELELVAEDRLSYTYRLFYIRCANGSPQRIGYKDILVYR